MSEADYELVERLRSGDERAFAELVDRYSPSMLAVARTHVASREVAEDVVQDTWLALLKGIDGFEGRSSLRTWLFRVLVNIAKTRGVREKRSTPVDLHVVADQPRVDPDRFRSDDVQWPGHWVRFPMPWRESPEHSLLSGEALDLVRRELARLPEQQRIVVSLRDVDGYDADEVCTLLDVTAANQRVLLHRGRARIREALAGYFAGPEPGIDPAARSRQPRHHLDRGPRPAHERVPVVAFGTTVTVWGVRRSAVTHRRDGGCTAVRTLTPEELP